MNKNKCPRGLFQSQLVLTDFKRRLTETFTLEGKVQFYRVDHFLANRPLITATVY